MKKNENNGNVQDSILASFSHLDMNNIPSSPKNAITLPQPKNGPAESTLPAQSYRPGNYIETARKEFSAYQNGTLKPPLYYTEQEFFTNAETGDYEESSRTVRHKLQNKELYPLG